MKKIFSAILLLLCLVLVSCTPKIEAQSIVAASDTVYLNVDSSLTVEVTVLPSDTADKTLQWTIADQTQIGRAHV